MAKKNQWLIMHKSFDIKQGQEVHQQLEALHDIRYGQKVWQTIFYLKGTHEFIECSHYYDYDWLCHPLPYFKNMIYMIVKMICKINLYVKRI